MSTYLDSIDIKEQTIRNANNELQYILDMQPKLITTVTNLVTNKNSRNRLYVLLNEEEFHNIINELIETGIKLNIPEVSLNLDTFINKTRGNQLKPLYEKNKELQTKVSQFYI